MSTPKTLSVGQIKFRLYPDGWGYGLHSSDPRWSSGWDGGICPSDNRRGAWHGTLSWRTRVDTLETTLLFFQAYGPTPRAVARELRSQVFEALQECLSVEGGSHVE